MLPPAPGAGAGAIHLRLQLIALSRLGVALVVFLFLASISVCAVVGSFLGPKNVARFTECHGVDMGQGGVWRGNAGGLERLNQHLTLECAPHRRVDAQAPALQRDLVFRVDLQVRAAPGEPWRSSIFNRTHSRPVSCLTGQSVCEPLTLFRQVFLKDEDYSLNVSIVGGDASFITDMDFTFSYVPYQFTLFELWTRFGFLMLTLVVALVFWRRMSPYPWADWFVEQKWVAVLLLGLVCFNNPLYALVILVDGWFAPLLIELMTWSFVSLLLLFWLILFDGIRLESKDRTYSLFYAPKVIFVGSFWVGAVIVYTWLHLKYLADPTFVSVSETQAFLIFSILLLVITAVYTIWLLYLLVRAYASRKSFPLLGPRIRFFGLFTMLVISLTVVGICLGVFGPEVSGAAEFLVFWGIPNTYCFVLAFVALPVHIAQSQARFEDVGIVRLEEEEDDSPSLADAKA